MVQHDASGGQDAVERDHGLPQEVVDEKSATNVVRLKEDHVEIHDLSEKIPMDHVLMPRDDVEYVRDKISTLSLEDCQEYSRKLLKEHEYDYNLEARLKEKLSRLLEGPVEGQDMEDYLLEFQTEVAVCKFFSPYPEVRAVAPPTDDPNIPCETFRSLLLGYIWVCVGQFVNSLFNSRYPSISLSSSVVQVLLYPCGMFLHYVLPDWGLTWGGKRHSLNPGPWTYKEQMLATIIVDVGITSAYCFWNIQTQTIYYHDTWLTPGYGILLLLSNQLMGLGFSGLMRRFVIYPTEAIWPALLPTIALNRALLLPEKKESIHGWRITRYKFFFLFFGGMFCWYWFPGYIFTGISFFAWMTWISPNNFNLNTLTGSYSGIGLNPISTLDWNVCQYLINPLAAPFWSSAQLFSGMLVAAMCIIGVYYNNISWTAFLPINSSDIFDNTGQSYNISRIIDAKGVIIESEYQKYSPPYYSAANLVLYGAFFLYYPLTMVFVILDAWRPILRAWRTMARSGYRLTKRVITSTKNATSALIRGQFREALESFTDVSNVDSIYDEFDDPFINLVKFYPEVPDWWFLSISVVALIFALIIVTHWTELGTPVWTIFFVIGINLVFLIPMTYLEAISGLNVGLNVVTELIVGYALPGHPEALMLVKSYGYNINGQTDNYVSDQKMGYYAKLPPRAMYRGQIVGAIISALVCYGVVTFVDDMPGVCTPNQKDKFTCVASSQIYFSASVIWGAIGPARVFAQLYPKMKYTFLFGFLLGLAWWTTKRFGPRVREAARASLPTALFAPLNYAVFTPLSWLKFTHPSLVITGFLNWAPYNLSQIWGGMYFSFAFMWYLRKYKTAWWEKYNYVLSAALGAGVAFSGVIIFFAVQYKNVNLNWWGNVWVYNTLDAMGDGTLLPIPASGTFGLEKWS